MCNSLLREKGSMELQYVSIPKFCGIVCLSISWHRKWLAEFNGKDNIKQCMAQLYEADDLYSTIKNSYCIIILIVRYVTYKFQNFVVVYVQHVDAESILRNVNLMATLRKNKLISKDMWGNSMNKYSLYNKDKSSYSIIVHHIASKFQNFVILNAASIGRHIKYLEKC